VNRRKFITLFGGAAAAWPLAARAQQSMPVIGFVSSRSLEDSARFGASFSKGLGENGWIEGRNVIVQSHWLGGQNDRLPSLMADLVRRRVAVIATVGDPATLAARAATASIPIAFGISEDPVKHGVVASLARPGGNATGINFFSMEVATKRLGLLHELVPAAVRIAVVVNPTNPLAAESMRDLPEAARAIGLQIKIHHATTSREIEYQTASQLITCVRNTPGHGSCDTYVDLERLAKKWAKRTAKAAG